ncbi:hypothetical protein L7F22_051455 [Adiantum nelumboides]|nr:hypothetical protein [Adiantum nelumboides]
MEVVGRRLLLLHPTGAGRGAGFEYEEQARQLVYIVFWCIQEDLVMRPNATKVVEWLESGSSNAAPASSMPLPLPLVSPFASSGLVEPLAYTQVPLLPSETMAHCFLKANPNSPSRYNLSFLYLPFKAVTTYNICRCASISMRLTKGSCNVALQLHLEYEESSDESSYGDEESYTNEESSMEVMGLAFQQPHAKGSLTSKEVEVVTQEEPMLEEQFMKMLAKDLTKEEEEDYINMFKRYPHLFITDYSMIKGVDVIQHHIDLKPDAKPVAQKLRKLEVVQQEALLTEVNKLLKDGFIYPVSNSEWVSPIVVIPKKNGKWKVCVDYKPLNAATKRDHFPLPFQDEILNEVARHERYTVCDDYLGYYQIRIAEEDQHKTTFITPWGCFAFRVMPLGLTNAPSTFTRFTSFIFQPFFGKSIRVFLDDFCTYSDRVLHCQRVEEGLQRLYQYGGQLNSDKCHVAEKEVVLLRHVISQAGIKVDPSCVQAILDLPPPNSAR